MSAKELIQKIKGQRVPDKIRGLMSWENEVDALFDTMWGWLQPVEKEGLSHMFSVPQVLPSEDYPWTHKIFLGPLARQNQGICIEGVAGSFQKGEVTLTSPFAQAVLRRVQKRKWEIAKVSGWPLPKRTLYLSSETFLMLMVTLIG